VACQKVKEMYYDNLVEKRDLYLFMGTHKEQQQLNRPQPFVVIGTFYPPKQEDDGQLSLF